MEQLQTLAQHLTPTNLCSAQIHFRRDCKHRCKQNAHGIGESDRTYLELSRLFRFLRIANICLLLVDVVECIDALQHKPAELARYVEYALC